MAKKTNAKAPVVTRVVTDMERVCRELEVWDVRMERAAAWFGLVHHPVSYRLISDSTMLDLTAYDMMMPTDVPDWTHGKRAEQQRKNAGGFHVFEAATNINPSIVWLGVTNTDAMQVNVMSHATYGHVVLCTINYLFAETAPETALQRFAQYRNKIQKLVKDPRWGWEGVEYIQDAARALENHSGWLPTIQGVPSDEEMREQLEEQADLLRERIKLEGAVSVSEEKALRKKLEAVEAQLKRNPIKPTNDLLGYLKDPRNTPNLEPEARMILDIYHDRSRYLQPVGRTKFMHEGWASFWEKAVIEAPHVGVPFEFMFDLAKAWSMHDSQVATQFYFDPYSLGVRVWNFINKKYGYDEGEVTIERPKLARDEAGVLYETDEIEQITAVKRNYDKMFEVARTYEDNRFLTEFLSMELLEEINEEALNWVLRFMTRVNGHLRANGWGAQAIFDPLPTRLEDLMAVVQAWMQQAEMSEYYHQNMGTPMFPVPKALLSHMGQVLQIIMAYDKNKHAIRKQLVLRTGARWLPNIYVVDDGRHTDGVLTLRHDFDPTYGPLLQSECRDTLKFFRRLYGRPVRLLTMEVRTNRQGEPIGDPVPYEYIIEKDTVRERFL
jgi:spore cortex formation protein SpoVR/YcgB (stage V sporulation)